MGRVFCADLACSISPAMDDARYVCILSIFFCRGFSEDSWRLGGGLQLVLGCLEFFVKAHVPEKSIKDVPCTKLMDDYVHPRRP
jgi:hypothetical protein